ncbi:hypothetical protein IRP63_15405 (plasmid) [Clostridium botulinum]|uniref:Uncharacterized protein n=1 Tax=Clostridium botulinum C/D str. DC5 TaxID=1443128 RepID=A0A0A0I0S1_CLOBO|nr:hypothetical protein [Clostridium botulinum]KGM93205.1 hypothetical protein Z955_15910 [Clostridium botulinum C/D str. DC5]KOC52347.1 hypothetical protein ADU89_11885 [Clostridium botulinum]KOC56803.1 hypothetical protein ADU90_07130 [Clostridium botulinum]MCD3235458.1 hypothetical protein [Clostridium botulinum D/C]MCD3241391.1 hypothetical protein [Clostridium botulinum D/C]
MRKLPKNIATIAITSTLILGNSVTALAYQNYKDINSNIVNKAKLGRHYHKYVENKHPYLVINLEGVVEETGQRLLGIPLIELDVNPGETMSFKKIIQLIQSRLDAEIGNNIYRVKGFLNDTYLKEGYSETLVKLINGKDIAFPRVSKDIKQPKYNIMGEILLEKLPEVVKPKEMINNIEVIYTPEFFLKSNKNGINQLSLFPEVELGVLNAGYKISSEELKKYAQAQLDNKFGAGKYIIESRKLAFSQNVPRTDINDGYELLSELDLNENFEYEVKSQYKDVKADKYRDLIVDKFYVKEKNTSNEAANTNIEYTKPNTFSNKPLNNNNENLTSILNQLEEYLNSQRFR